MSALKSFVLPLCCVLAYAGLVSPAHAQLARDPEATEAYEQGLELAEQENWEEAIVAFTRATEIDDTFAEAYQAWGDALRALEDYPGALTRYRQALDINPQLAQAFNGRGVCYRELGQLELALNDFNNAIELDRRDPDIAANLGDMLINDVGDPINGMRVLEKAAELDPENAEVYRNLGWGHTQLRQFDEAEENLQKAIELEPDNFEFHSTLASILLFQEKHEPALDALTAAIEHYEPEKSSDPETYVSGYLMRADAQLKLALDIPEEDEDAISAAYDRVIADADAVLDEIPDTYPQSGQALYRKGVALRMQERLGEAIKALTDAIQLIPPGEAASYAADAHRKRGICWHLQGEERLARRDFEEAAAVNYEDPLPYLWIGFTYAEEEDYRAAIVNYSEAISRSPSFALAYVNRGLAYMQLDEYQRAVDNFNDAIRHEPTNASHFVKRGLAYLEMEEFEKAFASFELAILNDDQLAIAYRKAAEAARELGRSNLAEEYEARANELDAMEDAE